MMSEARERLLEIGRAKVIACFDDLNQYHPATIVRPGGVYLMHHTYEKSRYCRLCRRWKHTPTPVWHADTGFSFMEYAEAQESTTAQHITYHRQILAVRVPERLTVWQDIRTECSHLPTVLRTTGALYLPVNVFIEALSLDAVWDTEHLFYGVYPKPKVGQRYRFRAMGKTATLTVREVDVADATLVRVHVH